MHYRRAVRFYCYETNTMGTRLAVIRSAKSSRFDVVRPKKWNFVRAWVFSCTITMLLAIPYKVSGLCYIPVVRQCLQSSAEQSILLFFIRQRPYAACRLFRKIE